MNEFERDINWDRTFLIQSSAHRSNGKMMPSIAIVAELGHLRKKSLLVFVCWYFPFSKCAVVWPLRSTSIPDERRQILSPSSCSHWSPLVFQVSPCFHFLKAKVNSSYNGLSLHNIHFLHKSRCYLKLFASELSRCKKVHLPSYFKIVDFLILTEMFFSGLPPISYSIGSWEPQKQFWMFSVILHLPARMLLTIVSLTVVFNHEFARWRWCRKCGRRASGVWLDLQPRVLRCSVSFASRCSTWTPLRAFVSYVNREKIKDQIALKMCTQHSSVFGWLPLSGAWVSSFTCSESQDRSTMIEK